MVSETGAMKNLVRRIAKMDARALFLAVLLVSVAFKIGFVVFFESGLDAFPTEGSDNIFYHTTAINWLETGVYGYERGIPMVAMPPGQSAFLAAVYAVSGQSFAVAKLAQILLLSLVAGLTFLTGRALFGNLIGLGAGMLLAIDPAQAYLSATFLSEPLFIFLMCLGIYFLVRQRAQAHWAWLAGAGICFGLAGLTRNQGWLFAGFLVLAALATRGRLLSVRAALLVGVVTVGVIVPWTFRNYLVSGEFIPVSSEGGLTLWASNNPEFVWRQPMPMSHPIYARPPDLDSHAVDEFYRARALEWIRNNPAQFAVNGIRKVIVLYSFDPLSARPEVSMLYRLAGLVPYGLLLPFILLGLVTQWRDERLWVIYAYILFTTLLTIMFWGDSRIRAPIQPYLYLFGVLGARQVVRWWQARRGVAKTAVSEA
jgi:4-amino-4-deoxy-L-arabinose transferase-like glycosyltransferase